MYYSLEWEEFGIALWRRICPKCSKFVGIQKDESVGYNEYGNKFRGINGVCKKHGIIEMPFEGWFSEDDLY